MGGNMVRPDLEMVHNEIGYFYYQGKVYNVVRLASGWELQHGSESLYAGESVDDCSTWLMAQLTY